MSANTDNPQKTDLQEFNEEMERLVGYLARMTEIVEELAELNEQEDAS